MNDDAHSGGDDAFTPEEQAVFDAYASGGEAPAETPNGAGATIDLTATEVPAGNAAAAAPAPAGEAAAPGDVVDPESEDGSPEENKGKFVRHGAFHQEREKRKAAERQLAEMQERFTRGDERLKLLTQAMQAAPQAQQPAQAAPEPEQVPDPNEDIFGYAKWLEKQVTELRTGQQQMTEAQKQQAEADRAADQDRAIVGAYHQDISRFAATEPAFNDAYRHLVEGRVAELKLYGLDDSQAIARANAEEMALIRSCIERGVSPAEQAFAMAKTRGFTPKAAEPATPAAPPAETPAEKQQRLAAGRAAAKSLSSAGGAPAGEVTLEMLASMSEAEFDAFAAKNPTKLARLMGQAA